MGGDDTMKTWHFFIGILAVLLIVSAPALAISKSDLISYYKGQSVPAMPIPTPTVTPTPAPTQNPQIPAWLFPYPSVLPWDDSSFNQPLVDWKTNILDNLRDEYSGGYNDFRDSVTIKKPNIYLYSDRDLIARVRLAPEHAITVSEPLYQPGKGWLAKIRNGSLNGNGDFLFYEALVPDAGWQKEQGYVIRASHRGQDMAEMLGQYGFNEKETVDFVDYWTQHLAEGADYVFYPLETGAVDRLMPLSISPEPDHVSRIWFYAEPLVSAPDPVTSPEKIVREGFYVVEWGVMIR
jgi:hypothetical protein